MKKNNGFSIIEILTVLVIVALLAAAAVPSYKNEITKARVSTSLIPVLYGYKDKLESLIKANPANICVINKMGNFNGALSKTVHGVGGTYIEATGEHIIQVAAKMQGSQNKGIGVKPSASVDNRPIILELKMRKNGEGVSWSCSSEKAYSAFVPYVCQQSYGITTNLWKEDLKMGVCYGCYLSPGPTWPWLPEPIPGLSKSACRILDNGCIISIARMPPPIPDIKLKFSNCHKWAECSGGHNDCPGSWTHPSGYQW